MELCVGIGTIRSPLSSRPAQSAGFSHHCAHKCQNQCVILSEGVLQSCALRVINLSLTDVLIFNFFIFGCRFVLGPCGPETVLWS